MVRVIAENMTNRTKIFLLGDRFFESTKAHLLDDWATGMSLEVAPHIHFITLSLQTKNFTNERTWDDGSYYLLSRLASLWALKVNNAPSKEANMKTSQNSRDMLFPVIEKIMDSPEFVASDRIKFRNKD